MICQKKKGKITKDREQQNIERDFDKEMKRCKSFIVLACLQYEGIVFIYNFVTTY